ncbi:maltose ABC transporter substrate-binding protein [Alicyclobacillus sp. TC]|uniref:sugar ABC transporter substrate-binding protein n=1 Tax=Alicyclobacillus sp. TC TaxID=2606450 RepID=UPI0019344FDF|nr:maltose ABC transporter substrate-binding protein [Alicyclobacillus sp. TC]QRF22570.1 maltose ABC transporter substrate-binding protein [Alicyclobacillus sp. TC]
MKKTRLATGAAALVVMGGLVAGCGSPSSNSTNSSGSTTSGSLPKGQTITVWSWAGGPQLQDVKKIADAWAKKHGDTVKVVDESHNANGFQFYATAARSGKGPDIVFGMPHDNNGTFAEEGLMAPVPSGDINTSNYAQSVVDAVTVNGTIYSVPVSVQTTALFYNTSKIKTPPTNWTQFVSDANKYGFAYAQHNLYFNYAFVGGLGGYVFKDNNGTLNPNDIGLDNAGAIKAYQLMYDMDHKYHWMQPSLTGTIALSQFTSGKTAMYISGPWDVPNIQKAKIPFSIAPLPTLSNGHPMTPFLGVITAFVSSKSPNQPADWSLVKALTNSTAQMDYFNDSQQIPALTSLQQSSTIQSSPMFKAFADEIPNAVPMPNIPQMQAVWNAMSILKNIISGQVSPAQGGKDFVANIQKGIQVQGS